MTTPKPDATRSVERAIDLLFGLAVAPGFTGVTALAGDVGLGKSTVHRLLQTLVQQGMVAFNPTLQAYGLGGRILELGLAYQEHHPLIAVARPTVEMVRDRTQQTATLYIPIGFSCVALDNAVGVDGPRIPPRDARAPLHVGAFGKVLYAYAPEEFKTGYEQLEHRWTGERVPPLPLADEVERIREQGFARSIEGLRPKTNGLAFPLLNGRGAILAAVSVAGRSDRWTEEHMDECTLDLLGAMKQLTEKVGGFTPDQDALVELARHGLLR